MPMLKRSCVVLLVILASACGSSSTTTSPTPTPTPTPAPTVSPFSVTIGAVPSGAIAAVAQLTVNNSGVVGAVVTFLALGSVIDSVILHEFTHVAGAHHANQPRFIMFKGYQPGVSATGYAPEELQVLGTMFGMPPTGTCPADSATIVMEMVCGDNSANINNPGGNFSYHITKSIVMRVDPSLSTKMAELQAAADAWAGHQLAGFTITLVPDSSSATSSTMSASSVPGTRTITIVD